MEVPGDTSGTFCVVFSEYLRERFVRFCPDKFSAPFLYIFTLHKYVFYNYNIIMEELKFEWDENKNRINKAKHGVSFEEAQGVFLDANALMIPDEKHSEEEERYVLLGYSLRANLLVVCHCYRYSESVIRIISARKATKPESQQYYEQL